MYFEHNDRLTNVSVPSHYGATERTEHRGQVKSIVVSYSEGPGSSLGPFVVFLRPKYRDGALNWAISLFIMLVIVRFCIILTTESIVRKTENKYIK
jgi:hypothetical protein